MRSRRRHQRGAASVEALLLLPFFFLVWGCMFYATRRLEKRVVVNEIARTCAWEQMSSGCTTPPSPRCGFIDGARMSDDQVPEASAFLGYLQGYLMSFSVDFRAISGPLFRPLFGTVRQAQVSRPRPLGGGSVVVDTAFLEMCNEIPGEETVPSLSTDSFCSISGWCN